jgi:hypothetical protein
MMGEPVQAEETRRGVAKMAVEESSTNTQASRLIGAMAGWEKVKRLLDGKKIMVKGNRGTLVVVDEETQEEEEGLSEKAEWDEEVMGGTVVVEDERVDLDEDREQKETEA